MATRDIIPTSLSPGKFTLSERNFTSLYSVFAWGLSGIGVGRRYFLITFLAHRPVLLSQRMQLLVVQCFEVKDGSLGRLCRPDQLVQLEMDDVVVPVLSVLN